MGISLEELAEKADVAISAYPNAGLPNPLSPTGFDLEPADMARYLNDFANGGLINIAGGCCGNTPEHIAAMARATHTGSATPVIAIGGAFPMQIDEAFRKKMSSEEGQRIYQRRGTTAEFPFAWIKERMKAAGETVPPKGSCVAGLQRPDEIDARRLQRRRDHATALTGALPLRRTGVVDHATHQPGEPTEPYLTRRCGTRGGRRAPNVWCDGRWRRRR